LIQFIYFSEVHQWSFSWSKTTIQIAVQVLSRDCSSMGHSWSWIDQRRKTTSSMSCWQK